MKRIHHPYWDWEDYKAGILDLEKPYTEKQEEEMANKCKELLSNSQRFYDIGLKVINRWKNSAEQNLSNSSRNRQAWIGQACCCFELGIPERITKYGWRLLSVEQQDEANRIADKVIKIWEENQNGQKSLK